MVLQSDYQPQLLNSLEEKLERLSLAGIDYCIVLDFTLEFAAQTAEEFIRNLLVRQWNVKKLLIGYDHRFGHNRAEGFEDYVRYGRTYGLSVIKARQYTEGNAAVSSSEIRRALSDANVEKAALLLTYPFTIRGTVVGGFRIGHEIGFPTANILPDDARKIIPPIGVYAVWVYVDRQQYKGMLYIGRRPTVNNGDHVSYEVNILDFDKDIYNKHIVVSFMKYVRGDVKFESLDGLKVQLEKDREEVRQLLS